MSKGAKKNDPGIRIRTHAMTGTTGIVGITTIPRKTSRRMKTTVATTEIIKGADATRITV
jgi:hypothetical protein